MVRVSKHDYETEDLADVRFVPLLGEEGWAPAKGDTAAAGHRPPVRTAELTLAKAVAASCEPFDAIGTADLEPLVRRMAH